MSLDDGGKIQFIDEAPNTKDLLEILTVEHEQTKVRKNNIMKALDDLHKFYTEKWEEKDHPDQIYQYARENQNTFYTATNSILQELHAVYPIVANLIEVESRSVAIMNPNGGNRINSDMLQEGQQKQGVINRLIHGRKDHNEIRSVDTLYKRSDDMIDETKQFPRNWGRWLEYHTQGVISAESKYDSKGDLEMQELYILPERGFVDSYCRYALLVMFGENHRLVLAKEKENVVKVTTRVYEDRERHSTQFRPEQMSKNN